MYEIDAETLAASPTHYVKPGFKRPTNADRACGGHAGLQGSELGPWDTTYEPNVTCKKCLRTKVYRAGAEEHRTEKMASVLEGAWLVRFSEDRAFCYVWRGKNPIVVWRVSDWAAADTLYDSRAWEGDRVRMTRAIWEDSAVRTAK
jgi:hypothetical protein